MTDARRPWALAIGLSVAAGAVLIAAGEHNESTSRRPAPPVASTRFSLGRRSRPPIYPGNAPVRRTDQAQPAARPGTPGPRAVAVAFTDAYLACAYTRGRCSGLPGALPALSRSLVGRRGAAISTPAERAARPRITGVRLLYACPDGVVAIVTYTDGRGGSFELHPALARERAGWRVWNLPGAGIWSQRWPLRGEC